MLFKFCILPVSKNTIFSVHSCSFSTILEIIFNIVSIHFEFISKLGKLVRLYLNIFLYFYNKIVYNYNILFYK